MMSKQKDHKKKIIGLILSLIVIMISINYFFHPNQKIQMIKYKDLPFDVKKEFYYAFSDIDNSEVLFFCKDLSPKCPCNVEAKYKILSAILDQRVIITNCKKKIEISFENVPRFYIIKNDTLYYPNGESFVIESGQPLSSVIDYKSLHYFKVF